MAGDRPHLAAERPRTRRGLATVRLDDELVLYDEDTATLHHLNPSATLVWSRCDGHRTTEEIAAAIAKVTGEDLGVVRPDVEDVVRRLVSASLLLIAAE